MHTLVTQLCPTHCDPMNRSMPGLPVHHQLLEFIQTHVHRVGDAIQPSHLSCSFCCSVTKSCPTLCDPMNCSTPGLPVHHQLLEFIQTHVHRVSDAIQPSHPLSSPSSLPPIPTSIRVFSNKSTLRMRWPKYWSFMYTKKKVKAKVNCRMSFGAREE